MNEPACQCGSLDRWAEDPRVPVTFHADTGTYSLHLSGKMTVPSICCWFCGGHAWSQREAAPTEQCRCGLVKQWAGNTELPVRYDAEVNEYQLRIGCYDHTFYFCPACRDRMPPSRRAELFEEPSEDEMEALKSRIQGLTSIEEVLAALGEPDERHGPIRAGAIDREIHGAKDIMRSLAYRSLYKTVMLWAQEDEDGELHLAIAAQAKEDVR